MHVRSGLLVMGLLCAAIQVRAQEQDVERSKDHPMVSRFPGYYISDYDTQDFGSHEFSVSDGDRRVEGRYWKIEYMLKDGTKKGGPLEIGRNYASTFTQRGGQKMLEELDSGGGRLTVRMPAAGKHIWLEVAVTDGGQIYTLTIVEEAALVQQVEFTAMELAKQIKEQGTVALHGIVFDTGKASIKPESKAALAPIGEVLKNDATLRLEIRGHTDNVGAAAANLKLSQDRAAAVKTYVVSTFAVAPDRLTTAGFGDTKPIADNTSDAGRAQNRRVELVRK